MVHMVFQRCGVIQAGKEQIVQGFPGVNTSFEAAIHATPESGKKI